MIGLTLTLDYEVYGDGGGSLNELAVMPTAKFLKICDEFNVKSTIFVDVAEILAMKKQAAFKNDVLKAEQQLIAAHNNGHDIQLHIHPWWFGARYINSKWKFDLKKMSLSHFKADEVLNKVRLCKDYLNELLRRSKNEYSCIAFRAGSWSMMPTENIFNALTMAGIKIDSSVYKWGKLDTELMKFDYNEAHSNIHPWFFSRKNVNMPCEPDSDSLRCLEIPIYTEKKRRIDFLTLKRIKLMRKVKSVVMDKSSDDIRKGHKKRLMKQFELLLGSHPKKLDFCKCNFGEMKNMIANIVAKDSVNGYLPVVAIGHSKDFIYWNDLQKLLAFLKNRYFDVIEMVSLSTAYHKYVTSIKMDNEFH